MASAQISKLVKMANDIAANLAASGDQAETAARVRDHLNRFWSPSMKQHIMDHAHNGGEGLSSVAMRAVTEMNQPPQ